MVWGQRGDEVVGIVFWITLHVKVEEVGGHQSD